MATIAETITNAVSRAEGARIRAEAAHHALRTDEAEQQADIARRSEDIARAACHRVADEGPTRRLRGLAMAAAERGEAAAYACQLLRRLADAEAAAGRRAMAAQHVADAVRDAYDFSEGVIEPAQLVDIAQAAADGVA